MHSQGYVQLQKKDINISYNAISLITNTLHIQLSQTTTFSPSKIFHPKQKHPKQKYPYKNYNGKSQRLCQAVGRGRRKFCSAVQKNRHTRATNVADIKQL